MGLAGSARAATFVGLTDANSLVPFASPGSSGAPIPVTGLQSGETLVGIDFRPQTSQLYGVGSTGRVYAINRATGAVTAAGPPAATLSGTYFGVDFNPVADRLRVVSDADQNLRLNPEDGTVSGTDSALQYGTGDPNQGANPNVVAAAYTNSFLGAGSTVLYGIDSALDRLVMQTPPNMGTLSTVGPLGADFADLTGLDVLDDGTAWATRAGTSTSVLYSVNLATGQVAVRGTVPARLLGLAGEPTGAAGPFAGQLNRLSGNQLMLDLVNNGARPVEYLAFELMNGYMVSQVGIASGPPAPCMPHPTMPAAQCGPFGGPAYWAGGGQALGIAFETDPRYPDNGGAALYTCAAPCAPYFRDFGPVALGGPSPAGTAPPPGDGTPGGPGGTSRDRFDFNGDGDVDFQDVAGFVNAVASPRGFTHDLNGPGVDGSDINEFVERLVVERPAGASTAPRRKRIVIARGRATVRGGETERVRIPLTKAGRRFLRAYRRKRLRVTVRLRVRHVPAAGTAETRSFKGQARFRVKRKRR